MNHKEELFILACAIGVAARQKQTDILIAACKAMASAVTSEDRNEADKLLMAHAQECGCAVCTMALEERAQQQETPLDNSRADDSFAV